MKTKRGLPDMTWQQDRQLWRKRGTYKGHSYEKYAKDPEGVVAKIKEFEAWIDSGMPQNDNTTVWEYIQQWYPSRVADLKEKSKEAIDNVINNHIVPHIGNMKVSGVKPLHIGTVMAELKGKSNSLQSKVLNTLRQIFDSAIDDDIIVKNPCKKRKPGGVKAKPKDPLTHRQQDALIEAVKGSRAELFTLLCMHAGLQALQTLQ